MTNLLLSLAILVWPFGQLLSLTPINSVFRLQLLDLLALLLFFALFIDKKARQTSLSDPLFKPLALFVLAALLSLFLASFDLPADNLLLAVVYFIRFVCYTSFYFAIRLVGLKKIKPFLIVSAGVFLAIGFLQYFFLPDTRFLKYLGFDDHYYRLIGTFFDPNFTGVVLAIMSLVFLGGKGRSRYYFLLPLVALALTFSRASYLSLALGLIYLIFAQKKYLLLLIFFLFPLLIFFSPRPFGEGVNLARTFSVISRIDNQKEALVLFSQRPIFGLGFNTLKKTSTSLVPNLSGGVDNSFLFVAVTTGIVGFLAFLNFLIKSWRQTTDPFIRASLVALLAHSLINNTFFYSWVLVLFLLLIGIGTKKSV